MLYLTRDQLDPDRISGLGKNNSAHQVYPSYSTFFYEIAGTFNAGTISLLAPAKSLLSLRSLLVQLLLSLIGRMSLLYCSIQG